MESTNDFDFLPTARESFERSMGPKMTLEELLKKLADRISVVTERGGLTTLKISEYNFNKPVYSETHLKAMKILREKGYSVKQEKDDSGVCLIIDWNYRS